MQCQQIFHLFVYHHHCVNTGYKYRTKLTINFYKQLVSWQYNRPNNFCNKFCLLSEADRESSTRPQFVCIFPSFRLFTLLDPSTQSLRLTKTNSLVVVVVVVVVVVALLFVYFRHLFFCFCLTFSVFSTVYYYNIPSPCPDPFRQCVISFALFFILQIYKKYLELITLEDFFAAN